MLNGFVWFRIIAGRGEEIHGRRLATFTPKVVQVDWAGSLAECNSSIAPSVQSLLVNRSYTKCESRSFRVVNRPAWFVQQTRKESQYVISVLSAVKVVVL
jgi:hypothetical protein